MNWARPGDADAAEYQIAGPSYDPKSGAPNTDFPWDADGKIEGWKAKDGKDLAFAVHRAIAYFDEGAQEWRLNSHDDTTSWQYATADNKDHDVPWDSDHQIPVTTWRPNEGVEDATLEFKGTHVKRGFIAGFTYCVCCLQCRVCVC